MYTGVSVMIFGFLEQTGLSRVRKESVLCPIRQIIVCQRKELGICGAIGYMAAISAQLVRGQHCSHLLMDQVIQRTNRILPTVEQYRKASKTCLLPQPK